MADIQLDKTKTKTSLLNYIINNSETYNIYNEIQINKQIKKGSNVKDLLKFVFFAIAGISTLYILGPVVFNNIKNYIQN